MNKLKPFTFWIVLGVILFCEILWWVLSIPDIDLVGNKAAAQKMQTTLKQEYTHLTELERRGKNGSPLGVFDAEKPEDIRRLTDEYLVTPAWKEVLDPHVLSYDKQLKAIKERLAARSKHLHEPIAASNDKFGWYTAYQNASEEQLKKLSAAGALAIKASADTAKSMVRSPTAAANGAPANPGMTAAPAATTTNESHVLDFANDSGVRAQAGFFTKGADLPDAAEYPVLTRQFRTMERVITVITETATANTANPLVNVPEVPVAGPAGIVSVTWDATETSIGGEAGNYAAGWRLSIMLQGPLSALLATTAALEHPAGDTSPIFIITGGELMRKPVFAPGERKDVGSEVALARIELLVLDFSDAPTGVKPVAAPKMNNAASYPGMNGPPMGMPSRPPEPMHLKPRPAGSLKAQEEDPQ